MSRFRLVDCQLQAIRKCKKRAYLYRILETLPKDLHEQYTRELANISEASSRDALKLLQWLTFPQRKLRFEEAVDMIAVDIEHDPPFFDEDSKLNSPDLVMEIVGSLVRTDINPEGRNSLGEVAKVQTLTVAHATVSDYLKTQSIKIGPEPEVRFTKSAINLQMAETCLAYLRYFMDKDIELCEDHLKDYPFARLCAEFWDDHYREILANPEEEVDVTRLDDMIMELFDSEKAMLRWVRLCDPDDDTARVNFGKQAEDLRSPIYYAALLGLPDIVSRLIDGGADMNFKTDDGYGTPLVAASALGRIAVVSILLDRGADPTLCGSDLWGCPLAAAVQKNDVEIVKMLLQRDEINVNCLREDEVETDDESADEEVERSPHNSEEEILEFDDDYDDEDEETQHSEESMVYIAAQYNSPEVMRVLLDAGADPNIVGGEYGTALQAACASGREDMVMWLLDKGAKLDLYGGYFGDPLRAACYHGFTSIAKAMIAAGSDVSHEGGDWSCPLYAACLQQREDIVELLLGHGASTDVYGAAYDSALQAACSKGNIEIAEKLLAAGSNVNHKSGWTGTALYVACDVQKVDLVELLLQQGAFPNTTGCGLCDNALQISCERGNETIIRLLLDKGADPNIIAGHWGNSMQAACYSGNEINCRLLLEKGAKTTLKGGYFGTIIQAAIYIGSEAILKLLLDSGVSANEKGGNFTYLLLRCCACEPDHVGVLRILLENGADPNLEREGDGIADRALRTALQHTSSEVMTNMLLDHGAKVNTQIGHYGTALHRACAAASNLQGMIETLIQRGADPKIVQWFHGTALHAACKNGKFETVKFLVQNGAELNDVDMVGRNALHVAMSKKRWDVFDYLNGLEEARGKALCRDKRNCSGVHYAASSGKTDILQMMIEQGADVNSVDFNGWSPLHWAASNGFGSAKMIMNHINASIDKELRDKQGRTALDIADFFVMEGEAKILRADKDFYEELPEFDYGAGRKHNLRYICDICGDVSIIYIPYIFERD